MSLYDNLLDKLEGRQYSNYFTACCIFHSDTNPSMFVYEDGRFRCASCGKTGSLTYLDKMLGSHFRPISVTRSQSNILPRWRKWEEKYGDLEGIAKHAHQSLKRFPQFQGYFKKRKIDDYIEEGYFGYLDGWAIFPVVTIDNKLIDIITRAISGKGNTRYVIRPISGNNPRTIYSPSWAEVVKSEIIYVVYGLIDSWSLHAIGLPVVTGITGKSLSANLLKPLNKKFIIIPDLGEERDAHVLANKLGWRAEVREVKYPLDTKDCDGIRVNYGNTALLNLLGA